MVDVNDQINVAGAGVNIGQRVMDCGDAGHILLSNHVAEDLAQYRHWQPHLHDLGECEVKHGLRLHIFNLAKENVGNPNVPQKFRRGKKWKRTPVPLRPVGTPRWPQFALPALVILSGVALAITFSMFFRRAAPITARNPVAETANTARPTLEKSIAVLPFENLSANRENEFFTAGVQDEILLDLAKIADLKVISRTSVMQYESGPKRNVREISQQLGVAHVLEGSVQRTGSRIRVTAQLIDARTDTHLWAEQYDREVADVFAIQSEIAKKIADHLRAQISLGEKSAIDKPPTTDLNAHDLYLRAQALWGDASVPIRARENLSQAAELLDEAVTRDPNFLLAWCLLSRTHGAIYRQGYDRTQARLDLAKVAGQTALHLQPDAGEAHLALANYYYYGFRDYNHAFGELVTAGRTLPNNAEVLQYTGLIDRRQGRWAEATGNLERALELDPRNAFILQQLALTYAPQRRYADEARTWDRLLTIEPGDPSTRIARARVELNWRANLELYQATLSSLIAERPSVGPDIDDPFFSLYGRSPAATARALETYPSEGVSVDGVDFPRTFWKGAAAHCQGEADKAQAAFAAARTEVAKMVKRQPDFAAAMSLLGVIDAGLGRTEEALSEGRRACELLPSSKDAVDGPDLAVNLALIYAWTGKKDLAIEQIKAVERLPSLLSYGFLKLHPFWDSLRGEPAFERIVASLAPNS